MAILTDQGPPPRYNWPSSYPVVFRLLEKRDLAGAITERKYELLPNIRCLSWGLTEGPHAGHAQFTYLFDEALAPNWPHRIEHCQQTSGARGVVRPDDRLVVAVVLPTGKPLMLFDGFASIPEANYAEGTETVTFQAVATPVRLFDRPIIKSRWRDGGTPNDPNANKLVHLPTEFNPDGRGNCTAYTKEAHVKQKDGRYRDYAVFMDPLATGARRWKLSTAVGYILAEHNDETYVKNPSLTELGSLLDCWSPKPANGEIDPNNPSTYTKNPIDVSDEDVTGKVWPQAVRDLIGVHGYIMKFDLEPDSEGFPVWRMKLGKSNTWERKNQKTLYLQRPRAGSIDSTRSNVAAVRLAYDFNSIFNFYVCRSKLAEYEVSIMLACLFAPSAGDVSNLSAFKIGAPGFDSVRNRYRGYGLDELGRGHWNWTTGAMVNTVATLRKILGGADQKDDQWVQRARPAKRELFSKDSAGNVRGATLDWIKASDYKGPIPGPWDGTAKDKFNRVKGSFDILDDEFGIWISCQDPSKFDWSDHPGAERGGVLSLVEAHNDINKRIYFRLTARIQSDVTVDAEAKRRKASPTRFDIMRSIQAGGRYKAEVVSRFSQWGDQSEDKLAHDDIKEQILHAEARRFATEVPPFAGPITFPWFTGAWKLWDRATGIQGRNWSLTANAGSEGGPIVLPRVVSIEWNFTNGEQTTIHLSDLRVGKDYSNGI